MSDKEKVIKGLHDIGDFIADRVGFEQAKNFLHTIDEVVSLLKEHEVRPYNCPMKEYPDNQTEHK